MKNNFIDMTGKKIGKLKVLYRVDNNKHNQTVWKCICECGNKIDIRGYVLRSGKVKSCGKCMRKSCNKWDLKGEYGIGYDNQGRKFYFSKEDFDIIQLHYWRVHKNQYVSTALYDTNTKKIKYIQLHRFLMKPNSIEEIDHINHIPYDNRRENLRIVSVPQNQMNSKISLNNTSGVKGVNFDKNNNKWRSRISVNGKRINLGQFLLFQDAVNARINAEKKYYGEYRYKKEKRDNNDIKTD